MSLRIFVDSGGNEWHAYDVVPPTDERRSGERRSNDATSEAQNDRRDAERRLTIGTFGRLTTMHEGWLCFERDLERRRLSPIPEDWRRCTDSELEAYCHSANRVPALHLDPVGG
jgi:hypothetical protein